MVQLRGSLLAASSRRAWDRRKGVSTARPKAMTKSQILSHVAEKAGVTKKTARLFIEELAALA